MYKTIHLTSVPEEKKDTTVTITITSQVNPSKVERERVEREQRERVERVERVEIYFF